MTEIDSKRLPTSDHRMESEAYLERLRLEFPLGWRFLGWPKGRLSFSDIADIQAKSVLFCLPVLRNVPVELENLLEEVAKMAPKAMLSAAEKASQKGSDTVVEFLRGNPEGELEPFILAHFHLAARAEFARQLGAELHRDGMIRFIQRVSGLRQDVVRDLWSHIVAPDVKLSRGSRSVGEEKRSVDDIQMSVGPKNAKVYRFHGRSVLSYLERVISQD